MIKEHDNNIYIKQQDKVESYLLRIIHRYFDIQNNNSKESVEAIIVESLARLKQTILTNNGFIFSLNDQTGNVILSINALRGEEVFDKQSAFNKDFGLIENTICQGDDKRLYDNRLPLKHQHTIADIKDLMFIINQNITIMHKHYNKDILDLISYTGERTSIDLILLDFLESNVNEYIKTLEFHNTEVKSYGYKAIKILEDYLKSIANYLEQAKTLIETSINWLDNFKKNLNTKISSLNSYGDELLNSILNKEQLDAINNHISNTYCFICDGEIPIQDNNTFIVKPIIDEIKEENSTTIKDSLRKLFDDCIILGNNGSDENNPLWTWDDKVMSFRYNKNEDNSYPRLIGNKEYEKYIHKVNLYSSDSDDDIISIVLAYLIDDTGKEHDISLLCSMGANSNNITYCIVYNYKGCYFDNNGLNDNTKYDTIIATKVYSSSSSFYGWSSMTNGVDVAIKKDKNNFKVWVKYNSRNTWLDVDTPKEQPTFEFNVTDIPALSFFANKPVRYGYGCYSQDQTYYRDVYFKAVLKVNEPYGHCNISDTNHILHTITLPTSVSLKDIEPTNIKLYFKYTDKDGNYHTFKLPFLFKTDDGNILFVNGLIDENKNIIIQSNLINIIPVYVTEKNFYNQNTIIGCSDVLTYSYKSIVNKFSNHLCLIDSDNKNNFVKGLVKENSSYIIQGFRDTSKDTDFKDLNNNSLAYTNWDNKEPISLSKTAITISKNGKWKSIYYTDEAGYVLEYELHRLSYYFKDPKVYYKVFAKQGVVNC